MAKFNSAIELMTTGLIGLVVVAQAAATSQLRGDAERGQLLYAKCSGCHSLEHNRTGPKHCGVVGRKSGSVEGFEYSQAMKNSNIVWNAKTLDHFLSAPLKRVPGTTMAIAGINNETDRRDLISYLAALESDARCQ